MLNNFEKFSIPSIEKDGQNTKRQTDKKKRKKRKEEVKNGELKLPLTIIKNSIVKKRR